MINTYRQYILYFIVVLSGDDQISYYGFKPVCFIYSDYSQSDVKVFLLLLWCRLKENDFSILVKAKLA